MIRRLEALDEVVLRVVVDSRVPGLDRPVAGLSNVGRGGIVWVLGLIVARLKKPDCAPALARGSLAVLTPYALSVLLARLIGRSRPCESGAVPLVECPHGPSLPSDQAAGAFAGAAVLGDAFPSLRGLFLCVAAASAAARVYVGVHYPTDVAAGAALGTVAGRLVR